MNSQHQITLLRNAHVDPETTFDEYVAGASLDAVLDHASEYLDAFGQILTAQFQISEFSKQLEEPDANLMSEFASGAARSTHRHESAAQEGL